MADNTKYESFRVQLETLLNRMSMENGSNTPDFLLAEYLTDCLKAYDKCANRTGKWKNGNLEKVFP